MLTYSMYIADSTGWEVIVNNKVHSFEINSASHEFSTNKNPDVTRSKSSNHIITLKYKT